jgi:hypothetical protein
MAYRYDVTCEQYASFGDTLYWLDDNLAAVDLTGFTALMLVKDSSGNTIVTLSTANGRIVLGGKAGSIARSLPPAVTGTLAAGEYSYDLILTSPGGEATKLYRGTFTVNASLSHV